MPDLNDIWTDVLRDDPLLTERPNFRFDPVFYALSRPGLSGDPVELERHFREVGRAEGLAPTRFRRLRSEVPDLVRRVRRLVIEPRILEAASETPLLAAELAFELMRVGHDSDISNFSRDHYLATYPDIVEAGVDPLEHYLLHGIGERRVTLENVRRAQHSGARAYDPSLPTVCIALHELSNTGAPHVGLDLARQAAADHNVIVAALRTGPLLEAAKEAACQVVITAGPTPDLFEHYPDPVFRRIDLAICNSVEAFPFLRPLVARDVPLAFYIHEYAWYTFPSHKPVLASLFSDLLVFSAEHVLGSWSDVLADGEVSRSADVVVIPQRPVAVHPVAPDEFARARARLSVMLGVDCTDKRIVCGAGQVQHRKGTDIFAMAAQITRSRDPDTIFVWVGDGLSPEDPAFGAYLTHHLREVKRASGESNLFMLPAGDHYRDVLRAADAMLLTSRLDPLPNVVFDALALGCRVILFEGATGFADPSYRKSDDIIAVEYANPSAASDAVLKIPRQSPLESKPADLRADLFHSIRAELDSRIRRRRSYVVGPTPIDVPVLYTSSDLDLAHRTRERERLFTSGRRYLWRDRADASATLAASSSWVHRACSVVDYDEIEPEALPEFSLHMHAYYVDGVRRELAAHAVFKRARRLIVTTDTMKKASRLEAALEGARLDGEVRVVPNRGRDVLPFLDVVRDIAGDDPAEVWGHIHRKKSLATGAGGDVWRTFMTAILLGGRERVSSAVALAQQPDVGLVAPFDPFYGQWNASRRLLPAVEEHFEEALPANPMVYPMGNMFWVRASVVAAMSQVFPPDHPWPNEPIPTDGTEYHLIERLWPAVAARRGLRSLFISKPDQPRRP